MQVLERGLVLDQLSVWLNDAAEAGGGKTTVVQQLCQSVNGAARVLIGACDPLSTPRPLGPPLDIALMLADDIETK